MTAEIQWNGKTMRTPQETREDLLPRLERTRASLVDQQKKDARVISNLKTSIKARSLEIADLDRTIDRLRKAQVRDAAE